MAELLSCLPHVPVPPGISYENVFRVVIVQFMDLTLSL
jgi:7,8-dihydro-6-hydroxymethylpterin dimethyltransferase